MKTYYNVLEIEPNATINDIKRAYKKLALRFHPDINKEIDANEKFIEIQEAYEFLSNAEKRKAYDELIFNKQNSKKQTEDFENWKKQAYENAEKYSKTEYNKFKENIIDKITEVYETTKKGVKVGCIAYFGLSFFIGAIFGIYKLIEYFIQLFNGDKEFSFSTIFWSIFLILLYSFIGYSSYKTITE